MNLVSSLSRLKLKCVAPMHAVEAFFVSENAVIKSLPIIQHLELVGSDRGYGPIRVRIKLLPLLGRDKAVNLLCGAYFRNVNIQFRTGMSSFYLGFKP